MPTKNIIIDTDPGVDDILALLLALASPELNVLAITTVHGNIDLSNTTRNVLSLFNVLQEIYKADSEISWTEKLFKADTNVVLAAGASAPLDKRKQLDAAYFHGLDGLGGVSDRYLQYLPPEGWQDSFPALESGQSPDVLTFPGVSAARKLAHEEILAILQNEPADTVTIVAVGPLTNLSLACAADYNTFSRVKEIIVMGGALQCPGNVTPCAEFNFLADPEAAAHLFSFTSPTPSSTYPESPRSVKKRLEIKLLPLDTTTRITITQQSWKTLSPGILKEWCDVFIDRTFNTMKSLYQDLSIEKLGLSMHDPACIWYLISNHGNESWEEQQGLDIRIETEGRWTRGACIIDRRFRSSATREPNTEANVPLEAGAIDHDAQEDEIEEESDKGSWLDQKKGNRITLVSRRSCEGQESHGEAFFRMFRNLVFS